MARAARAAKLVPNPLPRRAEIRPFQSWEEIEAVAEGVGAVGTARRLRGRYRPAPGGVARTLAPRRRPGGRDRAADLLRWGAPRVREDEPLPEARTDVPARPPCPRSPSPTSGYTAALTGAERRLNEPAQLALTRVEAGDQGVRDRTGAEDSR